LFFIHRFNNNTVFKKDLPKIKTGLKLSVLNTPNRKAVRLIVCVAVDLRVRVIQVSFPRIRATLGRRPQVRVVTAIVVITIRVPITRRTYYQNNHLICYTILNK